MPKERLHLLLADLTLRRMESWTGCSPVNDRWKMTFLHGAMAPDLLYYDLPFFRLPAVGNRFHSVMEPAHAGAIPEPLLRLLQTPQELPNRPWLLGMAHHFMVDLRWHPLINGYSALKNTPCRSIGLNGRNCHHWLESELEVFWLDRLGPEVGYADFLKWLRGDRPFRDLIGKAYESLLITLGVEPPPTAAEITRCSSLQVFLMLEFVRPLWMGLKPKLLRTRSTRYVGALIAPRHPSPKAEILGSGEAGALHRLWESGFVDETVDAIATAFLSLPGWS